MIASALSLARLTDDPRALSLTQPWCDAVLRGGKRIENRQMWTSSCPPSRFRGECFLHASSKRSEREWAQVHHFAVRAGVAWRPPTFEVVGFGGLVGRMRVIGYVRARDGAVVIDARTAGVTEPVRDLTIEERRWYMGGHALVLDDVASLPFVAMKGMLGFFRVPAAIASAALGGGA